MKLWKKVYLLTLVVITICVNVGLGGIIYFTYDQMLNSEIHSCVSKFEMLRQGMSSDIAQMERSVQLDRIYFERFIKSYDSYYGEEVHIIGMVNEHILGDYVEGYSLPQGNGVMVKEEENTIVYLSQILDDKHPQYRIIMRHSLLEFDNVWRMLLPLYFSGGIVLSLGISMVLAFVVKAMLRPLENLEKATRQMQDENWNTRVAVVGNDELALLGNQFNCMADAVEENIRKLELQSAQKQELINNLAHEMNTPITSIRGFADYMMLSELSKEEQEECLGFISNESKRLKDISSTLLQMAQMQDKDDSLMKISFSMKKLCEKLEKLYLKTFSNKDINFIVRCDVDLFCGNEILMESLLRNLITNAYRALEYSKNGCISLVVVQEASSLKIEVSDNGCGIAEKHLQQIFEPFYRVDKERSRENGGSGLGLAFCQKIVELHHGKIHVESKVNEGTKFTINFTI